MSEKIMLIDGNSIVNRAFYGVPLLSNADGTYTNAVYGFLNILFKLMDEENPDYLGVAFDVHAPTFRHKEFEHYKGTRKGMPEELKMQMPILKEILVAMNIKTYEAEGFEADDILGTLARKADKIGLSTVVVSGDRDLLQLASDTLKIRIPKTLKGKTEIEDYFKNDVVAKYGVTPKQFIEVKALMGDAGDNVPGVPGIGEKTATKIIQEYNDVENAIAHAADIKPKRAAENLAEFCEQARQSRFLVEIVTDMPLEIDTDELKIKDLYNRDAYELFKKYEFRTFFERFSKDEDSIQKNKILAEIEILDSSDKIVDFLKTGVLKTETAFIIVHENESLVGISLYNTLVSAWICVSETFTEENLLSFMRPFFSDDIYKKVGHNVKKDIKYLRNHGIDIKNIVFDTAIGGYVLNPTRDSYEYDDLAGEFLNEVYPSDEEIFGKGKSKKSLYSIEREKLAQYAVNQARVTFEAHVIMEKMIKDNGQETLYYDIELPLVYVLADMESYGMKIDREALVEYRDKLGEIIDRVTSEIYGMAGEEFNINSTKQLGVILFEKLGMSGSKKTKTGYSTAADVLEKLRHESPIVEKILQYRQLAKLKSTYADGLLSVMDEKTDKIYSTFNQTITATGRISSTEPNLQNIPIRLELGRSLRKVFIPESDDFVFLDADYAQIELRVLADMAGDETLISAFRNGQDIHRLTASQVFGIPFDEVTSKQRSNAKAVNFGIVYGIGAFSLSQDLGITRREAEDYIKGYFAKYPKIKTYMDKTIEDATRLGYVSTIFGRRRPMPELNSNNFIQRSFGERVAMNMPIQGSAADIIKIAMVRVHKRLKDEGLKSRLVLQVHDELIIEAYKDEIEIAKSILKTEMEGAVNLKVAMEVDVNMGKTWFDAK